MKIKLSDLKRTPQGHIIGPTMLVNCSRRIIPAAAASAVVPPEGQTPAIGAQAGETPEGEGAATSDPDVVSVLHRLVSAIEVVPGIWFMGDQVVDFSHAGARSLREAMGLMNSAPRPTPVMLNHIWWDITAKAGHLGPAAWEDSKDIAPGINAHVIVNRKFDPKTAAGLEIGELDAGSISLDNTFSLSHPDMDIELFCDLQGQVIDGEKVRWLPEHTTAVQHYALVLEGADPDAGPRQSQYSQGKNWPGCQFDNPKEEGGNSMKGLIALLQMVCGELGISVALTEAGPMPEKLEERVKGALSSALDTAKKYNGLAASVDAIGRTLLREGEMNLTTDQVFERLPGELALAAQGRTYLEDVRQAVLKAFDAKHVQPDKRQALSEVVLRERKRIECSVNLEYLKDQLALLAPEAAARFGKGFRVSDNEDITGGGKGLSDLDMDRRLNAAVLNARMNKG